MTEPMRGRLGVGMLFRNFPWKIATTWTLVALENLLLALIPLFIGRAIDALLAGDSDALLELGLVMGVLVIGASLRRVYDTRAYGTMRVRFADEFVQRSEAQAVSTANARLAMSRELVDFLEVQVPYMLTSLIQIVVSIAILWSFELRLGLSGIVLIVSLMVVYGLFHRRFFRLNGELNAQTEKQVSVLAERRRESLLGHLRKLRAWEVKISDTEAVLYGAIFLGMFGFILFNLSLAATIPAVTAGAIFAILSYSWELAESGIALPATLQDWSRLSEISDRLNEQPAA